MDNEYERSAHILQDNGKDGSVKIADDVVAMIAGIATTEVEGIASMAGNVTHELMSKVGMKNLAKGVKVDLLENTVSVEVSLVMEYGYNIPTTCATVQEKVKEAITNMTGFIVSDVNIRIAGINMKK